MHSEVSGDRIDKSEIANAVPILLYSSAVGYAMQFVGYQVSESSLDGMLRQPRKQSFVVSFDPESS